MDENNWEDASLTLAPSPDNNPNLHTEDTGSSARRKALAATLKVMAADAKRTYIEVAADIGLNNSDVDADLLRRYRQQWKMLEECAALAQEDTK